MSVPSFIYSGVNDNIKRLNDELDGLGGGDARIAKLELNCVIDDRIEQREGQVLWPLGRSVGLRDPKFPRNQPIADSMKYFHVSSACRVSAATKENSIHLGKNRQISQWLLDGFNATVIAYGEQGCGKTSSLFGMENGSRNEGFVFEVLRHVFESAAEERGALTIGLSVWALRGDEIIESDEGVGKGKNWLEFATVECPSLEVAMKVLQVARDRCSGGERDRDKAHLFLRVLLHRAHGSSDDRLLGSISHLHVVDLIESSPTDTIEHRRLEEVDRIARRDAALQLSALRKVMTEVRDASRAAEGTRGGKHHEPQTRMTSARDSRLTLLLAPLIQGNTKTWVFLHLRDGEKHYDASLNSLAAFEGTPDITSACHRVRDIPLRSLDLSHPDTMLPPKYDRRPQWVERTHSSPSRHHSRTAETFSRESSPSPVPFDGTNHDTKEEDVPREVERKSSDSGVALSSEGFDDLMKEFNSLMAQLSKGSTHTDRDDRRERYSDERKDFLQSQPSGLKFHQQQDHGISVQARPGRYSSTGDGDDSDDQGEDGHEGSSYYDMWRNSSSRFETGTSKAAVTSMEFYDDIEDSGEDAGCDDDSLEEDGSGKDGENGEGSSRTLGEGRDGGHMHDYDKYEDPQAFSEASMGRKDDVEENMDNVFADSDHNDIHDGQDEWFQGHLREEGQSGGHDDFGTSAATGDKMEHVAESLMLALQAEKEASGRLEEKIRHLEEELMEANTATAVQAEGHKVEVLRLKGVIRQMASEYSHDDLLDSFEEDLARLQKENKALQRSNVALEVALAGEGSAGVFIGEDPGVTWTAAEGMTSANGKTTISIKEYRVLRMKLKQLERNYAEMAERYEDLRRKERRFILSVKHQEDSSRRLKAQHHQIETLREELEGEMEERCRAERDRDLLKEEVAALQNSERSMREERSRILSELALCRQRVREMDRWRRDQATVDRFVQKHAGIRNSQRASMSQCEGKEWQEDEGHDVDDSVSYVSQYLKTPTSEKKKRGLTEKQKQMYDNLSRGLRGDGGARSGPPDAISGVAGLSDSVYVREEEAEPMSLALEKSLLSLHDSIALTAPSLLPLVNKLGAEVRNERTASLRQKSELLAKYSNGRSQLHETSRSVIHPSTPRSVTRTSFRTQASRSEGDPGSANSRGTTKMAFFRREDDKREL